MKESFNILERVDDFFSFPACFQVVDYGCQKEWCNPQCSFQKALAALCKDLVQPAREEEEKKDQTSPESSQGCPSSSERLPESSREMPNIQVQHQNQEREGIHTGRTKGMLSAAVVFFCSRFKCGGITLPLGYYLLHIIFSSPVCILFLKAASMANIAYSTVTYMHHYLPPNALLDREHCPSSPGAEFFLVFE